MSSCSRDRLVLRRQATILASSTAAIAGAAPTLLRHYGAGDWTDSVLGLVVGTSLGIAIVLLIGALRGLRGAR